MVMIPARRCARGASGSKPTGALRAATAAWRLLGMVECSFDGIAAILLYGIPEGGIYDHTLRGLPVCVCLAPLLV